MSFVRTLGRQVRSAGSLAPTRPAIGSGIRGAIATIAPVLAAHSIGIREPGLMGLAGFGTAIVDKGGAYQARAGAIASLAVLGALSALVGALVSNTTILAVVVCFFWVALCSMARSWGSAGASVGSLSCVLFVVSLANHTSAAGMAFGRAELIVGGCAWGMLLALFLWPIRIYRPARIAVAKCYRDIASYADEVAAAANRDDASWSGIFRRNHTRMHESLDAARATVAATRRRSQSGRAERLLALLENVDQMLASVVGLADALEAKLGDEDARSASAALLTGFAEQAGAIAEAIEEERPIRREAASHPPELFASSPRLTHLAAAIQRQIEVVIVTLESMKVEVGSDAADLVLAGVATKRSPLAPLLDNLTRDSIVLRHALRVGAAAAIATALTHSMGLHRGYWMTIAAMAILQPYSGDTIRKGLQRTAGTIAGGIIAAVALVLIHEQHVLLGVIFCTAAISLSLLPINYAGYAMFTTPTFVLLAEVNYGEPHLIRARLVNTLLGAVIAFFCARIFWPTREEQKFPERLATALLANRRYLGAVIRFLSDGESIANVRAARRSASVAVLHLETSLQRLVAETSDVDAEGLMTLTVYARRMSVTLTALASARGSVRFDPAEAKTIDEFVGRNLEKIAAFVAAPLPDTFAPEVDVPQLPRSVARLAEQVAILRRAAARAFVREATR